MKTGSICLYAGSVPPVGFLECDGSAVSRTTYSDLFGILGTAYGAGDGSTTFNIPDLSGRVVVGSSVSYAIGSAGGEESHTLLTSEIPVHLHEVPQHGHENDFAVTTPELTHAITQPGVGCDCKPSVFRAYYKRRRGGRSCIRYWLCRPWLCA